MRRGQKPSAEQVVLTLRQSEVQTAEGKSLALACKLDFGHLRRIEWAEVTKRA